MREEIAGRGHRGTLALKGYEGTKEKTVRSSLKALNGDGL